MATFKINLYPAEFRHEEHAIYDELQTYLNSFMQRIITIPNFQYLKPIDSLTRTIKISLDQAYYAEGLAYEYTYCSLTNMETGNVMYYYITDIKWVSSGTAELSLEMDYMNTYRNYVKFTDNTHITRKFKDRWEKVTNSSYKPIIDKYSEEIQTPTLHRDFTKDVQLTGEKWYLVYYSDNSSTESATLNPIRCVCYGEKEHQLVMQSTRSSYELRPDAMKVGVYYHAMDDENPIECEVHIAGKETWTLKSADQNGFDIWFTSDGDKITIGKISFVGTNPVMSGITEDVYSLIFKNATFLYVTDTYDWQTRTSDNVLDISCSSTASDTKLPSFSSIYSYLKTQPTVNKIIELPTCPFMYKESLGYMTVPTGWSVITAFGRNGLFRTNYIDNLGNYFVDDLSDVVSYKNLAEYDIETAYDLSLETKIYNSSYYQVKYVYDVNSYQLQLEYGYDPVTITFDAAQEMSSNILFKFDSNTPVYSDLGNCICSVRSLEIPIYSSNYLEYMRYGKAIDEKNLAYSIAGSATQSASGIFQGSSSAVVASSMASKMSDYSRMGFSALGIGTSIVTSAFSTGITIAKQIDQINQKIEANKRTANGSSTTNDLSILNATAGNRLNRYTYVPDDEIKKSIQEFFRLYGYATDEYGQMTDSRYWNDYFVADVEFSKDTLVSNLMKEAIRQQYSNGVRIYHWHDKYDLDRTLENWETSIKNG